MKETDLFDLLSRWDVEVNEIPAYLNRMGARLSSTDRHNLLVRRGVLKRVMGELRDAMAEMEVTYRGVVQGVVIVYADTEDKCWAVVHDEGTVEFKLGTHWAPTDNAIAHQK